MLRPPGFSGDRRYYSSVSPWLFFLLWLLLSSGYVCGGIVQYYDRLFLMLVNYFTSKKEAMGKKRLLKNPALFGSPS